MPDLIGRLEPDFDHVAKFRADRTRGLGDVAVYKKKHLRQNISPSGTAVPGGLKSYSAHIDAPELLVYCKLTHMPSGSFRTHSPAAIAASGF